jgi:hypothetical protein
MIGEKMHVATLSDSRYLNKGLTMYRSLLESGSDFILHYLCLDKNAYDTLVELNLKGLVPHDVETFIYSNPTIKKIRDEDRWYFCMSMASYFSKHIMDLERASVTYVDSDIYFHKSINEMALKFEGKEIAIFRHRQFPLNISRPEGWFNVGVVFFRNSKFGKKLLEWWSDAVINRKYPELATCGDQKYLDRFLDMCPEDLMYSDGDIGHGAPWHWQLYDFSKFFQNGTIGFEGNEQTLYFTHFSQFSSDLKKGTFIPSTMHHIYTPLSYYSEIPELSGIYNDYFNELKKTNTIYGV